jgi:hypothetical protein
VPDKIFLQRMFKLSVLVLTALAIWAVLIYLMSLVPWDRIDIWLDIWLADTPDRIEVIAMALATIFIAWRKNGN